jgi:type II protein arginine methyltransferase
VTTPVTNEHFHERIKDLIGAGLVGLQKSELSGCHPDPIVPALTTEDTTLFPGTSSRGMIAYSSPWIDLCSSNPVVSSVSRQVLNIEVAYANFCGVRSIIIPGPRHDSIRTRHGGGIAQYARAIQEALVIGSRLHFVIHLPMYREPDLEETMETLSAMTTTVESPAAPSEDEDIELFSAWDSWHTIRSTCSYDSRLFVGECRPSFGGSHAADGRSNRY